MREHTRCLVHAKLGLRAAIVDKLLLLVFVRRRVVDDVSSCVTGDAAIVADDIADEPGDEDGNDAETGDENARPVALAELAP